MVFFGAGFVEGIWPAVQFEGRADGSKRNLNCLHSDARAFGKFTFSNSVGKKFQGGNLFVWGNFGEVWVHVNFSAVFLPMMPKALPFLVTCRHDAIVHGFVNSIVMTREAVAGFR